MDINFRPECNQGKYIRKYYMRRRSYSSETYWSGWVQNAFSSITGKIIGCKLVPINSGWGSA